MQLFQTFWSFCKRCPPEDKFGVFEIGRCQVVYVHISLTLQRVVPHRTCAMKFDDILVKLGEFGVLPEEVVSAAMSSCHQCRLLHDEPGHDHGGAETQVPLVEMQLVLCVLIDMGKELDLMDYHFASRRRFLFPDTWSHLSWFLKYILYKSHNGSIWNGL